MSACPFSLTHPDYEQALVGDKPHWRIPQKCRNHHTVVANAHNTMSVTHGLVPVHAIMTTKLVDSAKRHHKQRSSLSVSDPWRPSIHLSPAPKPLEPKLYGKGRAESPKLLPERQKGRRLRGEVPASERDSDHVSTCFLPRLVK